MEMEQEIDSIFENITERPTLNNNTIPTSAYFFRCLQIFVCLLGVLLNTVLIFVVLRSKQMKSRTNLVFANRCIYDILYLGSEFFYFFIYSLFGEAIYKHEVAYCALSHTRVLFEMSFCGLTLIFVTHNLVKLSTKTLLILGNSIVLVFYIAQVIQCVLAISSRHDVEQFVALGLGVLLMLVTLIKEVNRCRRNTNIPISKDSNFRLNIARILTYNWWACYFIGQIVRQYWMWKLTEVCMSLNAVYTFAYVFCADETYKTRILKVLKFEFELDKEDNVVYAKTTGENIVVDFKRLNDVIDNNS